MMSKRAAKINLLKVPILQIVICCFIIHGLMLIMTDVHPHLFLSGAGIYRTSDTLIRTDLAHPPIFSKSPKSKRPCFRFLLERQIVIGMFIEEFLFLKFIYFIYQFFESN